MCAVGEDVSRCDTLDIALAHGGARGKEHAMRIHVVIRT